MNALERAIATAPSLSEFALRLGVSPQVVAMWKKRDRVPAERVLDVERVTEGKVTRSELRPDIYPPQEQAAA